MGNLDRQRPSQALDPESQDYWDATLDKTRQTDNILFSHNHHVPICLKMYLTKHGGYLEVFFFQKGMFLIFIVPK